MGSPKHPDLQRDAASPRPVRGLVSWSRVLKRLAPYQAGAETAVPPQRRGEISGAGSRSFNAKSSPLVSHRLRLPQSPGKTDRICLPIFKLRSEIKYLNRGGGRSHVRTRLCPRCFPAYREVNRVFDQKGADRRLRWSEITYNQRHLVANSYASEQGIFFLDQGNCIRVTRRVSR